MEFRLSGLNFAPCAKRRPEKETLKPAKHTSTSFRANFDTELCLRSSQFGHTVRALMEEKATGRERMLRGQSRWNKSQLSIDGCDNSWHTSL